MPKKDIMFFPPKIIEDYYKLEPHFLYDQYEYLIQAQKHFKQSYEESTYYYKDFLYNKILHDLNVITKGIPHEQLKKVKIKAREAFRKEENEKYAKLLKIIDPVEELKEILTKGTQRNKDFFEKIKSTNIHAGYKQYSDEQSFLTLVLLALSEWLEKNKAKNKEHNDKQKLTLSDYTAVCSRLQGAITRYYDKMLADAKQAQGFRPVFRKGEG